MEEIEKALDILYGKVISDKNLDHTIRILTDNITYHLGIPLGVNCLNWTLWTQKNTGSFKQHAYPDWHKTALEF